jgi:hypothetical protein
MPRTVDRALKKHGLLLLQDKTLPSVATIVAGEPVKGSWWAHAKSHAIFAEVERLTDDPHVLVTRLIAKKVTFVHERLWPAVLAVAMSAPRDRLSSAARALLKKIEKEGAVRASGAAARELQERLLVHAREVHTESGRHETELQTWARWASGRNIEPLPIDTARAELDRAIQALRGA